jgi:hypothetical protein
MAKETKEIEGVSPEEFIASVQAVVDGLKDGSIISNPFVPETGNLVEAVKNVVVEETANTKGEEIDDPIDANGVIGKPVKAICYVTTNGATKAYGNSVVASRHEGVYKVTVRNFCKTDKVDDTGRAWSYIDPR